MIDIISGIMIITEINHYTIISTDNIYIYDSTIVSTDNSHYITIRDTIWIFNIAMENHHFIAR